ncbi:hypothetical protein Lal_00044795 [Lupinus albus]|nr:hypothetical protein Lal_00044795 [Lupinus albus]
MRLQNNDNTSKIKEFSEWILNVGDGKLSEPNDGYFHPLVLFMQTVNNIIFFFLSFPFFFNKKRFLFIHCFFEHSCIILISILCSSMDNHIFNNGGVEVDIPEELLILDFDNPIDAINVVLIQTYNNTTRMKNICNLRQYLHKQFQFIIPDKCFFSSLFSEEKEYLSSDEVDMSDVNDIEIVNILTPKFLNTLSTSGIPNHKIKLKVGTPIILLRNLDQAEGLCNGTRLMMTRMTKHVLEAKKHVR